MRSNEKRGMLYYRAGLSLGVLLLLLLSGGKTEILAPVAVILILFMSAGLIFLNSTRLLTLPFLLLCLLLIFCYDSFNVFMGYIWLVPLPVAALISHVIRLRPRRLIGESLRPLIAVSVATCLGGIGMISAAEYFRPVALFYVFGLGPGLVLVYLLLKNEFRTRADERAFATDLSVLAVTAALVVAGYYLLSLPRILAEGWGNVTPQWSNNIATLLMLSFPMLFVRARRDMRYLPVGIFAALAAVFSGSNAALPLASAELVICLGYLALTERRRRFRIPLWGILGVITVCGVLAVVAFILVDPMHNLSYSLGSRAKLLQRGFENFLENPLFGSGIGYQGNADLYSGKTGTMNWYHLFLAQVVGGLGIVGTAAWGYQLAVRLRLALRVYGTAAFGYGLCYLGLLLMSMLNPGEFCPVPYAFLAVAFFVMLERHCQKPFLLARHNIKAEKGAAGDGQSA